MWDYVFLECWSQFFSQISRELSASRAPRLLLKYGLLEQLLYIVINLNHKEALAPQIFSSI